MVLSVNEFFTILSLKLLDKINSEGIKSLTEQELTFLNSFSK